MRRGLSLIETILAASILSLVIMILFNLYPATMVAVRRAEHRLQASGWAQSLLEDARGMPFSSLAAMIPSGQTSSGALDASTLSPPLYRKIPTQPDGTNYGITLEVFIPSTGQPPSTPLRLVGTRAVVTWGEQSVVVGTGRAPNYNQTQTITQELWVCDIKN